MKPDAVARSSADRACCAIPVIAFLGLGTPFTAIAGNLECYEAKGTLNTTCIEPGAVRVNGDIRSSPLYMGGPKGVEATSFVLVTNCATRVTTLQDRQGKNFAGGRSNETETVRSLSTWVCAVNKPRRDPALRQF